MILLIAGIVMVFWIDRFVIIKFHYDTDKRITNLESRIKALEDQVKQIKVNV